jgi:hypothetical protein
MAKLTVPRRSKPETVQASDLISSRDTCGYDDGRISPTRRIS